ncbi:tandem C2 domains nuclear protein isoform X1 [Engraulis encrasicolus]|uniref:tandem C2 domains nuclear protein isoform X1 n=1 Tax=Engraulis encrasicolus TaxID=184585 RepID=UPI002FD1189F
MAAECIKDCCRFFQSKEDEPEPEAIPSNQDVIREDIKKSFGVSEDYLLSKLPPDGKEVPFVLPTFKPSYIQPQGARYSNYPTGQQGSARSAYAERKAEILGISTKAYDIDPAAIPASHTVYHISPGSTLEDKSLLTTPAQDLKPTRQRLSASMFDLSGPSPPPSYMQRYDSVSSVPSSTSSVRDSFGSSRSLESITLSGDERELGQLCVKLSYQEALEQVWITLVQCKDIPVDSAEHKIGIKGIITLDKPVQFKSTLKEAAPDALFMETFVFALPLQQLRNSALVLRLHLHTPRKRTLAECVLSLRQLSPEEAQYSLQLRPPSKSRACHAELHLATCFQPVNARMQLQVRSAQNLPSSSSPLTQSFFIKAELHSQDLLVTKKKTRALKMAGGQVQWSESLLFPLRAHDDSFHLCAKLYSRTSVRRRQFLGQVHLGFSSPSPTAVEQWRDTMANPEKVVADWHTLTAP